MTLRLTDVAGRTKFPLLAFPAGWWRGPVFVGDLRAVGETIRAVQLYYLTEAGDAGYVISHLAPERSSREDPYRLQEHLASFVSHVDPRFLRQRNRRPKAPTFELKDFSERDEIVSLAGHPTSVRILSHRELTLRVARTAIVVNGRATDLCIAGWRTLLDDALMALTPITAELARRFDLDAVAHGA